MLTRRKTLQLAASTVAMPFVTRSSWAQAYPNKPVRIVVGFAAGGGQDVIARLMAQWLSERIGQQFIVENRVGAGGNIAAESVVRSPPDGYTLVMVGPPNAINATLYDKLNFDFIRDIAPVASIGRMPNVVVVNPSVPAKTVSEFIAYAKANPGKINIASGGIGSSPHVSGELFKMMAGVDMLHVPYRGGAPALVDLINGRVQVMIGNLSESIEHIRTGKLRALAVTTTVRSEQLPDIPTVGETLPGYEASVMSGLGAPRNTPPEIIERLNREINAALANPRSKERLADLGFAADPLTSADFGKLIAAETEKWGRVIRAANIKAE